jgi:hypothetical protein
MFGLAKGGHRMMDEFERYRMDELVRVLGEIASTQLCPLCEGTGVGSNGWLCSRCEGRMIVPLLDGWEAQRLAMETLTEFT